MHIIPSPPFSPLDQTSKSISLPLPKYIRKFIQRAPHQLRLLPQIRRQEAVCIADGHEGSFEGVFEGFCGTGGGGVGVFDTSELEETFYGGGGHETGTTGSGDELYIVSWYFLSHPHNVRQLMDSDLD